MIGSPLRIMIVDDDSDIQYTFSIVVKRKGFQLAGSFADGSEAVAEFQKNPDSADAVVMDYRMPIMRGDQAAREIRSINPKIKIILLSGYQEDLSPEDYLLYNATLRKPVTIADFVRAIEKSFLPENLADGFAIEAPEAQTKKN
jgi:two-component system cell cycle sensor histidine kinase/response regulator CckA